RTRGRSGTPPRANLHTADTLLPAQPLLRPQPSNEPARRLQLHPCRRAKGRSRSAATRRGTASSATPRSRAGCRCSACTAVPSPASSTIWAQDVNRLRSELPEGVQRVLDEHEGAGTTDSPDYEAATMEFYKRHVCLLDPWPDDVLRTFAQLQENPGVYLYMQGPNEFVITGTL